MLGTSTTPLPVDEIYSTEYQAQKNCDSYRTRERLKKLATDSATEMLCRTSIPTVSWSRKVSISVGHAFFEMYDFTPVYCPWE